MYKIGASTAHPSFVYNEDYFRSLAEAGIDVVEISRYAEDYDGLDYRSIAKFAGEYGIGLWSFHLPFYPANVVDITTDDDDLRRSTIEYFTKIIGKATDIGIDKFIVHPGSFISENERSERLKRSMDSLDRIAEIAHANGATIAIENLIPGMPGYCPDEIEMILGANDKLRLCFDTNHLFNASHVEFIERFADKLITLHVSDFDFITEKHWLPGKGKIDWAALTDALERIGYTGPWMYEVNLLQDDNPLTFRDLSMNAKMIFGQK